MEGDSNKLPRSVGLSIAEHPNTTQFNPMFIYGPSGSGKTHLVNAIGLKVEVEHMLATGRIDLIAQTSRYIYVIELKLKNNGGKKAAIQQILDNNCRPDDS